ncbi:MAG TPA: hypothetical protein P5096_02810 [Patescibacteria group bacterium]|nr:hypothetical protein [Patescibacteria group bacterium]
MVEFRHFVPKDKNGKILEIGQRVVVIMGAPGWKSTGRVSEVHSGSSSFIDDNGCPCQRPHDFDRTTLGYDCN